MESREYREPLILEYEPLFQLTQSLPRRHGLLLEDVVYTCLDISPKYLALGSTKGLVVVYKQGTWEHKTFHESKQSVTVLKLNSCVKAVAVGYSNGDTFVILFGSVKDAESSVKRYVIREPDHVSASALEWEEGGEKLLIGYTNGKLVRVEMQFEKGTCDSTVVLHGSWNICQLSLCHSHLLISTLTCTLLMDMVTGRLKQVGQGKRKEGPYGGCFGLHEVGCDAFVARPGFRIWSVNNNGEVTKTVKLKDEILSPIALPILLLGQEHKYVPPTSDNAHFSLLLPWQSRFLVTFWQKYLWVLDPVQCCVIGALYYSRNIITVAACNDDIYMLSHDRSIVTKLSIRFDLQRFRPYVVPPLKDKGRDKEGIDCGIEDHLHKAVPASVGDSDLLSSEKARPLALMERDQQLKRLADFDAEQDISMLVKQVKKKGKRKGATTTPQPPHQLVSPATPLAPPSPKEYPRIRPPASPSVAPPSPKEHPRIHTRASPSVAVQQAVHSPSPEPAPSAMLQSSVSSKSSSPTAELEQHSGGEPEGEPSSTPDPGQQHSGGEPEGEPSSTPDPGQQHSGGEPEGEPSSTPDPGQQHSGGEPEGEPSSTPDPGQQHSGGEPEGEPSSTPDPGQQQLLQIPPELEANRHNVPELLPEPCAVSEKVEEIMLKEEEATDGDAAVMLAAGRQSPSAPVAADEGLSETVSAQMDQVEGEGEGGEEEPSGDNAEVQPVLESSSEKVCCSPLHHERKEGSEDIEVADKEEPSEVEEMDPQEDRVGESDDFWIPLNLPPTRHSITVIAASERHLWALDSKGSVFHRMLTVKEGHVSAEWSCDKSVNLLDLSAHIEGEVLWGVSSKGIVVKTLVPQKGAMVLQGWETIGTSKKSASAASVALGSNGAWVANERGEVFYRSGVSASCPKGTLWHVVENSPNIVKFSCCGVIVWAITKDRKAVVRSGVDKGPVGEDWMEVSTPVSVHSVYVSMDTVWLVGENGKVFFRSEITEENPGGCDPWWEVCTKSGTEDTEPSYLQKFVNPAQTLHSFMSLFTSEGPVAVAAVTGRGVWVLDSAGHILVCLSTLAGSHYVQVTSDSLFSICTWSQVAAGAMAAGNKGVAWLLRDDGELYSCSSQGEVSKMATTSSATALAASGTAIWLVSEGGAIMSREGIDMRHPLGTTWETIEMMQLGRRKLRQVGLGCNTTWAVDENGEVWFRFDVAARDKESGFAQVWLAVDQKGVQHPFTSVAVGPSIQYVWAVDAKHNVYVRRGVTAEFPIGRQWHLVEGAKGKSLCSSAHHVWVLAPDGSLLCREGIEPSKLEGRAWKRIPGEFEEISCTQDGQVWGVCRDGTVVKRRVKVLRFEHGTAGAFVTDKDTFEEALTQPTEDVQDWEFL